MKDMRNVENKLIHCFCIIKIYNMYTAIYARF